MSCASPGCGHPVEKHPVKGDAGLKQELPVALWDAPCTMPGCECLDYDGMEHPERPSLANLEVRWVQCEHGRRLIDCAEPFHST